MIGFLGTIFTSAKGGDCVCVSVSNFAQKLLNEFGCNFQGRSRIT